MVSEVIRLLLSIIAAVSFSFSRPADDRERILRSPNSGEQRSGSDYGWTSSGIKPHHRRSRGLAAAVELSVHKRSSIDVKEFWIVTMSEG